MRESTCHDCAASLPTKDGFLYKDLFRCQGCVEKLGAEAAREGRKITVFRAPDPTLCALCAHDNGAEEHATVAGMSLCPACTKLVLHRPFPAWLKLSAAVLLALLVAAIVRGWPMVETGMDLLRAEALVEARQYAAAADQLEAVLAASPECTKATLLAVKADLLCDRFAKVDGLVQRLRAIRFQGDLIKEVNALLERTKQALALYQQAAELITKNRTAEAVPLLEQARQRFPESRLIRRGYWSTRAGVRFEAKDYDGFLADSEAIVREAPDDPLGSAQVASGLAAKYAVTGEPSFRTRAKEQLEKARTLCKDDESRAMFAEYSERIVHRLESREVIDKSEYDRRFRSKQGDKK